MIRHSLLVVALLLAAPSFAEPIKTWPFKVFLDTTEIGQHHFELMQRDAEQEIHSRARFDLKTPTHAGSLRHHPKQIMLSH